MWALHCSATLSTINWAKSKTKGWQSCYPDMCSSTFVVLIWHVCTEKCSSTANNAMLGWWDVGTGYPEKVWMPHPWQCSRQVGWCPDKLGLVEGVPMEGRLEQDDSLKCISTQTILWVCDSNLKCFIYFETLLFAARLGVQFKLCRNNFPWDCECAEII